MFLFPDHNSCDQPLETVPEIGCAVLAGPTNFATLSSSGDLIAPSACRSSDDKLTGMLYFSCTIGQFDSCSFVDAAGKAEGTQLSEEPRDDVQRCDELPIQSNSEASKYIAIRDIALSQNEHGADMSEHSS